MILAPSDVSAAIPEIRKQIEDMEKLSGGGLSTGRAYIDNDDAAQSSADLLDTAVSLAERGRVIGYRDNFFDASALYATAGEPEGPFQHSPGSRYFIPPNRHLNGSSARSKPLAIPSGQTQDRFTRINVTETPAPELGDKALILRIIASFSGPPSIDIVTVSLRWRRGPIVAAVQVDTVNSKAYTSAVLQLALGMDSRINGVLTGAE
ncbi:MAG: hypothetical protein OTJ97_02850 [SAR202 cluster bacterium]|nr:hypothetical protein [SAR202 cluster bacterium]